MAWPDTRTPCWRQKRTSCYSVLSCWPIAAAAATTITHGMFPLALLRVIPQDPSRSWRGGWPSARGPMRFQPRAIERRSGLCCRRSSTAEDRWCPLSPPPPGERRRPGQGELKRLRMISDCARLQSCCQLLMQRPDSEVCPGARWLSRSRPALGAKFENTSTAVKMSCNPDVTAAGSCIGFG